MIPGIYLKKLNSIFAKRKIIVELLKEQQVFDITIDNLILIVENFQLLQTSSIKKCLSYESKQWLQQSIQLMSQEQQQSENEVSQEILQQLYNEMIVDCFKPVNVEEFIHISKMISQECSSYRHNNYQCTCAAILASYFDQFIIAIIPLGQGKTWIQALLGKYFCLQNQKITIIEPNEILHFQTAEKIGPVDYSITISTSDWFYQHMPRDEIIIINEYDEIFSKKPFYINNKTINGIWSFKNKKVFSFSATSSQSLEKMINNIVSTPKVIKFPSQYELLGNIQPTNNLQGKINLLKQDIIKFYEQKPIIIVLEQNQVDEIVLFLKREKLKFLVGDQILGLWVLLLVPIETRGLDTKFAKDALVLIIVDVQTEQEFKQYIGRGSRNLGLSEGILYSHSNETSSQIMLRLQRQNFMKFQQFEYLIRVIQQNYNNQKLIDILTKASKDKKEIDSIEQLKLLTNEKTYFSLMKNISF